jgi:hypothetical protein
MSLGRWKQEKEIKKAKKAAIKSLINEGSSKALAVKLVNAAYQRIKTNGK